MYKSFCFWCLEATQEKPEDGWKKKNTDKTKNNIIKKTLLTYFCFFFVLKISEKIKLVVIFIIL